jgi:hypothetical protein
MPIRVTCTKCHTRFNVSDKFAGKEGPCPKCKTKIRVPDQAEEVVIAAPKASGPLDSKGRPVLKPIRRKETILSGVQITLIIASIVGFLAAALVMRVMITDKADFPYWLLGLSAFAIAPALVYVAYAFLRNQELEPFRGQELWARVLICSAIYALAWMAMPLACFAFDDSYEIGSYVIAAVVMFGIGGVTGMFSLDLDYLMGTVHYGLYLGACLVGRWIALGEILPTNAPDENFIPPAAFHWHADQILNWLACCLSWLG